MAPLAGSGRGRRRHKEHPLGPKFDKFARDLLRKICKDLDLPESAIDDVEWEEFDWTWGMLDPRKEAGDE